jgi:hypothetical protein
MKLIPGAVYTATYTAYRDGALRERPIQFSVAYEHEPESFPRRSGTPSDRVFVATKYGAQPMIVTPGSIR